MSLPSSSGEVIPLVAEKLPRSRWRWPLRIGLLLLLLATVVALGPQMLARWVLPGLIASRINENVAGRVTIGEVEIGWNQPLVIRDLKILDNDGNEVLAVPSARTSHGMLQFLRGIPDFGTITIDKPALTLVAQDDSSNLEKLLRPLLEKESDGSGRIGLVVEVSEGLFRIQEPARGSDRSITPVNLTVSIPRSAEEPISIELAADVASASGTGSLRVAWTHGSVSQGTVTAKRFPAEVLEPLLARVAAGSELGGTIDGQFAVTVEPEIRVDGELVAEELVVIGPWLGDDTVRLNRAELPCRLNYRDGLLVVDKAELTCDVGRASLVGHFDANRSAEENLTSPGLAAELDVDLAKLATVIPRLLHLRDGIVIDSGRIQMALRSETGQAGTRWSGRIGTTDLRGSREGTPIAWQQPLRAEFVGHVRQDGWPEFEKLECQSDFAGIAARGGPEQFLAKANLDLDRLALRLADFVDLEGGQLSGTGSVTLDWKRQADDQFRANAEAHLVRFALKDAQSRGVREPDLHLDFQGTGQFAGSGPVRLETGKLQIVAAEKADTMQITLVEPIPDLRSPSLGRAKAELAGDLSRWRNRVDRLVPIPEEWFVAGQGRVKGEIRLSEEAVFSPDLVAELGPLRFRGLGLDLDEPKLTASADTSLSRSDGSLTFQKVKLQSETLRGSSERILLKPTVDGVTVSGEAEIETDLSRLQRSVGLVVSADGSNRVAGQAEGKVRFDILESGEVDFVTDLSIENLLYGLAQSPSWQEPWAKLATVGRWDPRGDSFTLRSSRLVREGLEANASGSASRVSSNAPRIDFNGSFAYDLQRLEPSLKELFGPNAKAVGKQERTFRISGLLGDDGRAVTGAARTGTRRAPGVTPAPAAQADTYQFRPDLLTGEATFAWDELYAYGFSFGRGAVKATLQDGLIRGTPIKAEFAEGEVRVVPTVDLMQEPTLSFDRGPVIPKARLTPQATADALGYILPTLANAAQVEGLVSMELGRNRIPLAQPTDTTAEGVITVHSADLQAGPVISQVMTALGARNTGISLSGEQRVPFKIEKGRVHHEEFAMLIEKTEVKSSGSVGFDGSLAIMLEMQVPPRLASQLFPNNPIIRDTMAKQTLRIPVGGTLAQPRLDRNALDGAIRDMVRDLSRDAVFDGLGGLLKKGLDKGEGRLRDRLKERLNPPPKD